MLLFVLYLVLLPYTRVFQTVVRDDSTGGPWRYDEKLKSCIYVLHSTYPVGDNCPSYLQLKGFKSLPKFDFIYFLRWIGGPQKTDS